ncbi:MAG: 5'/3'-nucleotidase SurE [Acidimicrobiales bacterium]|nr:5'/3'-nucleotidase SurE [Acidimicrobiales bacterium]
MRILVTNDDGIDSIGLHVLARAMMPFGDVVIVAPDQEYSGYGAAIGSIWLMKPEVHRAHVDGIDEAWSVSAAPALCAMFGRLGAFGDIDLVVSGINPGANVGRSVYHSGTVGACLTARNGGINSVAVSQSVDSWGVEGQAMEEVLENQQWQGAADVATLVVEQLLADLPAHPVVVNVNVPNRQAADMKGWKRTDVGSAPPRSMAKANLTPKVGHDGAFHVEMSWGDALQTPESDDTGAVMAGFASVTWLGALEAVEPDAAVADRAEGALDNFFAPPG